MQTPKKYLDRWRERAIPGAPGECWDWSGHKLPSEYGTMSVQFGGKRRTLYAHRLAYEAANGPIPDGMDVRHMCANRWCCNPDHLEIGTRRENMADARQAGSTLGRPVNPNSKRQQALRRRAA